MVAVLNPPDLTGFHRGLFSVSAEDDCVYLIADAGAIPLPRTRVLTTLDDAELSPIGADWGPMLMAPASPVAVGNTQFEGRLGGLYHGETGKFFIDGAHGLIAGPVVFDMMREVLDSRITFTRASSGTYFDSSGVMQTASTNVARLNHLYNGTSWVAAGLLVEPAATNLLLRSREFNNASWSKTDTTITADAANGVGGTATMDLCTEGSAGTALVRQAATITANSTVTFAVDIKRGNHDWVRLDIVEAAATGNNCIGYFNVATGATGTVSNGGTGTGAAVSVINLGNGVYRCILTGAVNNSATSISLRTASAASNGSSTRVNNGERYQDRAQLETGSVATSFIETTTATVTRAADVAVMTGTNFSNFFNPLEGAFVFEGSAYAPSANNAFSVSDGTSNNRMSVNTRASGSFGVVTGGSTVASMTTSDSVANTTFKRAVAYKADDFAISHNGAAVVSDTSGAVPVVDRLHIGSLNTGSQLTGHIRQLRYLPRHVGSGALPALAA